MLCDARDSAWCFMLIEFCNNVIECSVLPMMLYDVVMMNMIYHVVSIVSTMSKYAIGCTWCSMMNHDVGNVFIALTSFQRFAELFEGLHLLMQCDAHIVVMFVMTIFKKCPFLLVLTSNIWFISFRAWQTSFETSTAERGTWKTSCSNNED